jgi:hypothetical protein
MRLHFCSNGRHDECHNFLGCSCECHMPKLLEFEEELDKIINEAESTLARIEDNERNGNSTSEQS